MVGVVDRPDRGLGTRLRESAADDLLRGLGLERASPVLGRVARLAVGRFVADVSEMDAAIGRGGLAAAAEVLLPRYAGSVTIRGADRVPASGPLVVAANHAGTVDAPALWRLLARRDDLRIIALDRPILQSVPNLASRLLYVEADGGGRSALVRRVAEHLRAGGAVLTFPAGTIEPDPVLRLGDALTSLTAWGPSVELFVRLAPGAVVLPVAISGVISQRMLANPIARWRATPPDRELAAATLQVLLRDRSIHPVLSAGEPLHGPDLAGLRSAMSGLLQDCVSTTNR